jgi:hypothetical protein
MKDLLILLAHLLTTVAKLLGPGGARAVFADSLLIKQQLLVIHRSQRRAPNLSTLDWFLFGFWSLFLDPRHIQRAAVIIRIRSKNTSHSPCAPHLLPDRTFSLSSSLAKHLEISVC